ncbi:transporter [Candidatus Formimonas warabiya]|uniref:Transporter n=1 Tax=Formimonas warabiya TaxID=1761012 RepID=A0A3G1L2H3_FORW1|nr:transporter [Candidatus Formimonas warabiya]
MGRIDSVVFIISAVICFGFVIWGFIDNKGLGAVASAALNWTINYTGWMYMGGVFFFVLFCFYMAFSKYGKVKLGKPEDKPEYSTFSWFAMLFGCGMGVGLIFWSVAEPMYHFMSGPTYAGAHGSTQAAEWSMAIAFFHWGLSAWAVFVVIGIVMGIIMFKKGLPALMSTCLYPILGDRVYGPIGKLVDIVTLVATFFGMCTTIGLGTMQLASGVNFNYGVPLGNGLNIVLLAIVTICYLCSACLPIDKGIKLGSDISMIACLALMAFLFIVGPTKYILDNFVNATGIYLQNIVQMSLWTDPVEKTGWLGGWTIFYWAWWIAWAPFVGMFIAKISKGRTIKEFVLAALIAPTIFDMIFMNIFGTAGLSMELTEATKGVLWTAIQNDLSSAIYVLFSQYPLIGLVAPILLFVCFTFFVVSADSCTIVLGMLSSGGNDEPKISLKLLWGVAMGVSAGVLMNMGGLGALQTASIVGAFPFTIVMFFICYTTVKMLKSDFADEVNAPAKLLPVAGAKENTAV